MSKIEIILYMAFIIFLGIFAELFHKGMFPKEKKILAVFILILAVILGVFIMIRLIILLGK